MDEILLKLYTLISNDNKVERIIFRTNEVEFYLSDSEISDVLTEIAIEAEFEYDVTGKIVTLNTASKSKDIIIYPNFESLFETMYSMPVTLSHSVIILNKSSADYYLYDVKKNLEYLVRNDAIFSTYYIKNYESYLPLLKLFRDNRSLSEFDDIVANKVLIFDNAKERNFVNISYSLFDRRIFTKQIDFDYRAFTNRISQAQLSNNQEWISCLKHTVVSVMAAQQDINKTFAELFLNIEFIIRNTERDFEIYISGFSFEKISKALRDDKQKYFDVLNQAQDRIKSQVIAVPLSIGTSIYAFFQMETNLRNYYFILLMIAVYISFICWYLWLYEKDLKKLRSDIKIDMDNFSKLYPKVLEIFQGDFKFITGKIKSVMWLSRVIKITIILDWIILLLYVYFIQSHPYLADPFRDIFHLI